MQTEGVKVKESERVRESDSGSTSERNEETRRSLGERTGTRAEKAAARGTSLLRRRVLEIIVLL